MIFPFRQRVAMYTSIFLISTVICVGQDNYEVRNTPMLDEIVEAYVSQYEFSGNILIGQGDKIVYSKTTGLANIEHQVPNTITTKFRLASLSKQFTAAALLLLEQQGKVSFTIPISNYLPELKPAIADKINIHQLLSHSSGLARDIESFSDQELGKTFITLNQIIELINTSELQFTPGEKWAYSNTGYALAAAIIEKTTDMPYGEAMDHLLFNPLKMINTGHEKNSAVIANMASGYASLPDGLVKAAYEDKSYVIGAGSIYSSANDLFLWSRALVKSTLISKANVERLFTKQAGRYGYGWFIDTYVWPPVNDEHQAVNPHHEGGSPGFESKLSVLTKHDITVIILSNQLPSHLNGLANQLTNTVLGFEEVPPEPDGSGELFNTLFSKGIQPAVALVSEWKKEKKLYLIPSRGDVLLVGRGYMDAQDYQKAILIMDFLTAVYPTWSYPVLFKAIMMENQNKMEEAVQLYKQVLEIDPRQSNAIQRLKRLTELG